MIITISVIYAILISICSLISYMLGVLSERNNWNELIESGKIPKPNNK